MQKTDTHKHRLIQTYLQKIIEAYHPDRVYLTGSAVKGGGWDETSDLDLLSIVLSPSTQVKLLEPLISYPINMPPKRC